MMVMVMMVMCSPVNKDRVMDAMFNLPRMQLSAEGLPGTPTTLQVGFVPCFMDRILISSV